MSAIMHETLWTRLNTLKHSRTLLNMLKHTIYLSI